MQISNQYLNLVSVENCSVGIFILIFGILFLLQLGRSLQARNKAYSYNLLDNLQCTLAASSSNSLITPPLSLPSRSKTNRFVYKYCIVHPIYLNSWS